MKTITELESQLAEIESKIAEIYNGKRPYKELASLEKQARFLESDIRNEHREQLKPEYRSCSY